VTSQTKSSDFFVNKCVLVALPREDQGGQWEGAEARGGARLSPGTLPDQGVSAPVYLISPLNESDTSAPSGGSPPGFPKKSSAYTIYQPLQSEGHIITSLSRS